MALSRKVDHCIVTMPRDDLLHRFSVGNIGSDKLVALTKAEREIGSGNERTRIGQKVDGGYTLGLIVIEYVAYEVTADKYASSRNKQSHPSALSIANRRYPITC